MSLISSRTIRLGLALACAGLLQIPGADAQQRQRPRAAAPGEAVVVNRSSTALMFFFVTPVGEVSWGEDRLGSDVLRSGRRLRFSLDAGRQCRFDARAVYQGGEEETRFGLDLCQRGEIVLDGRRQTASADLQRPGPVRLFLVRNGSGHDLQTLRLVSSTGEDSGDILGPTIVEADSTFTGRFRSADGCTYDVVATFDGAEDQTLSGRDLCAGREIVFEAGGGDAPQERRAPAEASRGAPFNVEVRNRSAISIMNLYVRERGSRSWGRDLLGSEVLSARGSFSLVLPRGQGCHYDIRAVFDGSGEDLRNGVNLCETSEHVIVGPALAPGRGQRKATPVRAGQPQVSPVTIVNEATSPIERLFISSSRVSTWGDDLLGEQRIAPGERYTARVERDEQCHYDMRIVYQGGREERRMRQNICERREVAFGGPNATRVDGGGPEDGQPVVFTNTGRSDVREFYLTPVSDTHWGDDRLGQEILPRRFRFELKLPREGGCRWDIRIVFENGQSTERRDQDLCAQPEVAIGQPTRPGTVASTGTGFYITTTGHVLTNHHVVDGCGTVAISRPDGRRVPLRLIGADEGADLAVLREEGATATTPLPLREGALVRAGERVVLVGYPARSQLGGVNVTEGIVSGLRGALGDQSRFQYTAPTQPGNSGGPVLDAFGQVIGVVVSQIDKISGERTAQNINFGIKLDLVRSFLAANGVTPANGTPAGAALPAADILQGADPSVLPLDCLD